MAVEEKDQTNLPEAASGERGRGRLRRFTRFGALSALACVFVFAAGFALFADYVSSLATPRNPGPADAIIVVTGGKSRLEAAVDLLKSGKGSRLLISGVHPAAGLDDLRAVTGGDRRLFNCCVDIDHEALDTIGNAQESAKWLKDHKYGRAILVTNNYHMPRSMAELGGAMPDVELISFPVSNPDLKLGDWWRDPATFELLAREYGKFLVAEARQILPLTRPARAAGR